MIYLSVVEVHKKAVSVSEILRKIGQHVARPN
jgi:hypothetical protein